MSLMSADQKYVLFDICRSSGGSPRDSVAEQN